MSDKAKTTEQTSLPRDTGAAAAPSDKKPAETSPKVDVNSAPGVVGGIGGAATVDTGKVKDGRPKSATVKPNKEDAAEARKEPKEVSPEAKALLIQTGNETYDPAEITKQVKARQESETREGREREAKLRNAGVREDRATRR